MCRQTLSFIIFQMTLAISSPKSIESKSELKKKNFYERNNSFKLGKFTIHFDNWVLNFDFIHGGSWGGGRGEAAEGNSRKGGGQRKTVVEE